MLRVLDAKEVAFVSGGMMEDSEMLADDAGGGDFGGDGDIPDADGSYASQYPDDEYYKTPTYVDPNGDIVVTAPEKDSLSNYDWTSWAEVGIGTVITAIGTFGAGPVTTGVVTAGGLAAGTPPATKALDQFNRGLYHNPPFQDGTIPNVN